MASAALDLTLHRVTIGYVYPSLANSARIRGLTHGGLASHIRRISCKRPTGDPLPGSEIIG